MGRSGINRVILVSRLSGKGSQVYIEGQLKNRQWQDQKGNDRYQTEVVVAGFKGVMQMLGRPPQVLAEDRSRQPGWESISAPARLQFSSGGL